MATVLCVPYDDPVDGHPPAYARDEIPAIERYPGGQTTPAPERVDFTPGELLGSVSGALGLRPFPRGTGPPPGRHVGQARGRLGLRARADRGGDRDLPAVLARLSDRGADRKGAEPEARGHRRDRVRSRRPPVRDRPRPHGRRGDVLQQHQRRRARRDADPRARPRLPAGAPVGRGGRLEHRGRSLPLVRPRGHAGRDVRCRAHRLGRAPAATALRRRPALHRPAPAPARGRGGARRHLPSRRRVAGRGLRRRHDQHAAPPRDRALLRRRADRAHEARRLPRQHGARQDLRPRRGRARAGRAAGWPATRATCGSPSRRRATIPGGRCRTTG
jgi:hypothetical protein